MAGNELVTEGFQEGQVGSSAMPHKMNTRSCERVNGLAVVLRGHLSMVGELAGDQWNEGDVSCSVVRRVALPDAFFAADGLFETFLTVQWRCERCSARSAGEGARGAREGRTRRLLGQERLEQAVGREERVGQGDAAYDGEETSPSFHWSPASSPIIDEVAAEHDGEAVDPPQERRVHLVRHRATSRPGPP